VKVIFKKKGQNGRLIFSGKLHEKHRMRFIEAIQVSMSMCDKLLIDCRRLTRASIPYDLLVHQVTNTDKEEVLFLCGGR